MVASYPFDSGTEKPRGWDAKGIYSEGKISNEHLCIIAQEGRRVS